MATKMSGKVGTRASNGQGMTGANRMIDTETPAVVGAFLELAAVEAEDEVMVKAVEEVVVMEAAVVMEAVATETTGQIPTEKWELLPLDGWRCKCIDP